MIGRRLSLRTSLQVVAVIVLAVTVGGAVHGSLSASAERPDFDAEAAQNSAAVQEVANQVFESFSGTPAQRDASGVIQAWVLNGEMDQCMDRLGFPEWDWSRVRNQAPRTDALSPSIFFKDPAGAAYSSAMRDIADAIDAEESARVGNPPVGQIEAIDTCVAGSRSTSDSAADAAATPDGVADLREKWWSMLGAIDGKFGDTGAYDECFAAAVPPNGIDALVTGESWPAVLSQQLPPAADIPSAAEATPSAAWAKFVGIEHRWEAADWACRAHVYNGHIDDLAAAIDDFATAYATDIERVQDGWDQVEARARELGFDADKGTVSKVAR